MGENVVARGGDIVVLGAIGETLELPYVKLLNQELTCVSLLTTEKLFTTFLQFLQYSDKPCCVSCHACRDVEFRSYS